MKKILLVFLILIVLAAAVAAWIFLGSATGFKENKKVLYIGSNAATKEAVLDSLQKNDIVTNISAFNFLASQRNYWTNIKPGKYEIEKGSSLLEIFRMLRNGRQTPVNLVINKIRTKEAFAKLAGRRFEFDSAQMMNFLSNNDSLQEFRVDRENAMALVVPDTYTFFWNTTPQKVYQKLAAEYAKFWNEERKRKAEEKGFTPLQITTIASIVEEETNAHEEKDTIASVYMNRLRIRMPLQADPTVKFALKDFGLKRIYTKHTQFESPYNTYRNAGLPPGPICTPTKKTIDEVLNAPPTDYIYFVASPQFNGTHSFSTTYAEHLKKAREYQQALNRLEAERKAKTAGQ